MTKSLLDVIHSPKDLKLLTPKELNQLSDEIRHFIINVVSKSGGHLASNLGVVELTIALHYVFNSPFDRIVWDVGHQTYVHKILTGRKEQFVTLRHRGGLSGFPKRSESIHDVFETGHSSTSISAALGIARARDIKGEGYHVISVIGDGALSGGMAFEALNDAGHTNTNLMVILNDNEMSISKNVGALSKHLSKIRSNPKYNWMKKGVQNLLESIPLIGKPAARGIEKIKNTFKYLLVPGIIFDEMGFTYIGPIDGHDLSTLIPVMKSAAKIGGPVFLHIITQKGKGYTLSEKNPELFHGVPPFNSETGEFHSESSCSYSQTFGQHLVRMAKKDPRIVAITAAMPYSTGLIHFKLQFPDRFFDVGIAEEHAVTMAAGLASNGLRPYVAVYSTFLQRAYDQILHDVCLQNLPVVIAIDRAGLVGEDGETHQGVFDISFLRHIPNITIMSPKNMLELRLMMDYTLQMDGPVVIRYPRSSRHISNRFNSEPMKNLEWEILQQGNDCCLIATGSMVDTALKAAEILSKEKIYIQVVNARVLKPLDNKLLEHLVHSVPHLVTLEDNTIQGGFGSAINEFLSQNQHLVSVLNLGMPDSFIPHGSVNDLLHELKLDPYGVASQIKNMLDNFKGNYYAGS